MAAGVFKARCLAVMDEVRAKRQSVVITKHGKPVAKLVPVDGEEDDFFNSMRGKAQIVGDILEPVVPLEDWNLE